MTQRSKRLVGLLFVGLLTACGVASDHSHTPGPKEGGDETFGIQGTLVHREALGKTLKVEFWKTETGAASIVTGSVDEDRELSNLVNAALDRKTVAEAYLALPGKEGAAVPPALAALDTEVERKKAAQPEVSAEERNRFDTTVERLESEPRVFGSEARFDHQPARPAGSRSLLAPPAGWNWDSDYQWFRDNFCVGSQDCRTGFTWIYGGGKSQLTYHRMYGLNNSFDGTADFGSRWARWENGAWAWRSDTRMTLQARTYVGITRYDGFGPFLRDGWVSGFAVTNTSALSPTFTTTPLGTDPRVSFSQNWVTLQLIGLASSSYGSAFQNRCANNVSSALLGLPIGPSGKIRYNSMGGQRLPPNNQTLHTFEAWSNHIQGLTRLAGLGDNRWMAVTRGHNDLGRGGLFLVHLGNTATGQDGTKLGSASDAPSNTHRVMYNHLVAGVNHPGGLQATGRYVAVGVEAPTAPSFVEFYNFGAPETAAPVVNRFYLRGDQAENPAPVRTIGGAGLTRLIDSRYLLVVLGKDNSNDVWFYVSDSTTITSSTRWIYLEHFKPVSPGAQNVALITECTTGSIYLLATGNTQFDGAQAVFDINSRFRNHAYLWRLGLSGFEVTMTNVASREFDSGADDYCTFRAGAGPYVDPSGKLLMYCHTHHSPTDTFGSAEPVLKLVEYAR